MLHANIKPLINIGEGITTEIKVSALWYLVTMKGVPVMVYVLNQDGQPLMPTNRHGKIRQLLRNGQAKVISRCPFTVQLMYSSTNYTQPVNLGVDTGSKYIGVSATTESLVLYEAVVGLRQDISSLLAVRKQHRRARRNRKIRYREARFKNRTREVGWLAPSVQHKVDTHLTAVNVTCRILPVTKITVEVASFDIQKIKDLTITGVEYQQGEQLGFWNIREYIFFRDGHVCQCCKGKSKDKFLNVHHIESRHIGGDAPNNLVTLCKTCHHGYHSGSIKLPKIIKRGNSYRDACFMGVMRWAFYNKLKEVYSLQGKEVRLTYGYITKNTRFVNNLPKNDYIDARCISGNPLAKALGYYFFQKKVRCHNRRIHKDKILKGGYRKRNQANYYVYGFRLFDKVLYKNIECFIFARMSTGYMNLRQLDGTLIKTNARYDDLRLLEPRSSFLIEKRLY